MKKNPFLNALLALVYIAVVAAFMFYGMKSVQPRETIFIPIGMISLLTLSVAVMGYFFLLQPLQMYLDGEKSEAVSLFTKTVLTFACITALVFLVALVL